MQNVDPIAEYVARFGGTLQAADLAKAGFGSYRIKAAIAHGDIVALRRGLVGTPNADPVLRAALMPGGLLTCVSAAKELGLWTIKDPGQVHVWTHNGRHPGPFIKHRGQLLGERGPGNYVAVLDCVLHAIRCRPRLEALVIAESAVRRKAVTRDQLLELLPGRRNGVRREVVRSIGDDADSPLEVIARDLFRTAGLHVETQVQVRGVGRVDMIVERCLIVELDGFDFHWDRASFRKDRKRNNAAVLSGYPSLRYLFEDLVFTPEKVVAEVKAAVRRVA
jgi:very-short-patch-repair endonuclease